MESVKSSQAKPKVKKERRRKEYQQRRVHSKHARTRPLPLAFPLGPIQGKRTGTGPQKWPKAPVRPLVPAPETTPPEERDEEKSSQGTLLHRQIPAAGQVPLVAPRTLLFQ